MRNAEPSRDRRRVALVPVEELDDGLGLAECPDTLVDPRHVDRVEDEHRPADPQRMRGSREETGLGPAEAALEPVTELEAQPPMNVSYRRNTFRLMMTPAIAQAATFVSLVLTSGTSAKGMPNESTTWLSTSARLGSTPIARMISAGKSVIARLRKSGICRRMNPCMTTWPDIVPIEDEEKPDASRATPKRAAAPPPSSVSKLA